MNRQLHKKSVKAFFNSTSHFDFFQNDWETSAEKGMFTRLQMRGKIVLECSGCCWKCSFASKSKLSCNEEFKQDGLLMLDAAAHNRVRNSPRVRKLLRVTQSCNPGAVCAQEHFHIE